MIRKFLIPLIIVVIAIGGVFIYVKSNSDSSNQGRSDNSGNGSSVSQGAEFDKSQHSLTEPNSIWVVVNKKNAIPIDYTPDLVLPNVKLRLSSSEEQMQISSVISEAVEAMFTSASNDGVELVFGSGYRSGSLQKQFYDAYVAKDGVAAADTYSARPGHSEHQTGLAFDVTSPDETCHLQECFSETAQGKWLASNAYKYGFIIRYQRAKESITGYQYEPWHVRYVGNDVADKIQNSGQTLEEFFNLPPASNYD